MKRRIFFPLLACLTAIMLTLDASAQSAANDWGRVEAIDAKTKLIAETKAGQTIKGNLMSVTPTALNLSRDGRSIVLLRQDVARVYRTKKGSRIKSALIGAGIGIAVGIGIGVAYVYATKGDPLIAAGGLLYGLPIGAAIGGLTGGKTKKGLLIYESP